MKNKIVLILFGAIMFSVSSCKKEYLDTAPTDQVDNSAVFTTTANANTSLNGIYRYMFQRYGGQNQPGVGGMFLSFDFMGDDIGQTTNTWFTAEGSWNSHRADNSGMVSYAYRLYYRIIGNANFIIDNIDATTGSDDEKKRIKAEALTLRAYGHYYLVQMFGKRYDAATKPNAQMGVPLLISSTDTNKPRATVEEVYTQINKDLDDAIALNVSTRVNKSHINVSVAKGLRARVALTMQDYPNAIKFAKDVIDSGLFPLMSVAAYQTGFNDAPSLSEFMWASIPAADQADTFGAFAAQIAYNANTTYMRGNPKRINSATYNKISATDVRKKMWEPSPTVANFPLPTTGFQRVPFMSRKFSVKVVGQPTLADVSLMRSSELYLILAEAYAKTTGGDLNARNTLFTLVKARDPNAVVSINSGQALVEEILLNRRVELWGEGFRWLDLKRLNLPLDRSPSAFPNFIPLTMSGTVSIPAGDPKWQFLIPRAEIEANKSLTGQQNP
ncbi:MAG: RagB/SusD family nutrient uptake outer membrane protein [Daejeonella sp.]|uniref:RagB/SusD family nutrient uptake outer membrane protein n=1 Tax=Daejeonella sp. TaxID=2805397 RepID=UPI003C75E1D7